MWRPCATARRSVWLGLVEILSWMRHCLGALARLNPQNWQLDSFLLVFWWWFAVVCGGLPAFLRFHSLSYQIMVVVWGSLRWFVVVCGGLRWFAVVCLIAIPVGCTWIAASCTCIAVGCTCIAASCTCISASCTCISASCTCISASCTCIAASCTCIAASCTATDFPMWHWPWHWHCSDCWLQEMPESSASSCHGENWDEAGKNGDYTISSTAMITFTTPTLHCQLLHNLRLRSLVVCMKAMSL